MTRQSGIPKAPKCHAHRTDGQPCGAYAIYGGTVCSAHGGRAKHVQAKARLRLEEIVMPAIAELRRLVAAADSDSVKLGAIKDVLDRTGYKLPERIEADNAVTIKVEYEVVEPQSTSTVAARTIDVALTNGTTH